MRGALGYLALAAAIFLALPVQEWLPPVVFLHGARILLIPPLFIYGAVTAPFPGMLALAVYSGFLSDAWNLHVVSGRVEIAMGWSIVFFVILGSLLSLLRPAFEGNRRWWVVPAAMAGTSLYLALQFGMITLRRGGLVPGGGAALWYILGSGLLAGGVVALGHLATAWAGRFVLGGQQAPPHQANTPEP